MRQILVFTLPLLILCCTLACSTEQQSTPTIVLKTHIESMRKNDLAAIRQNLSSGTLKMTEQAAQAQNISTDEVLEDMSRQANDANKDAAIETRNEQIAGEIASVELKNAATGTWDKIPFVKEDGRWKIALDKIAEEIIKGAEEHNQYRNILWLQSNPFVL
jgi:hypothetical protein